MDMPETRGSNGFPLKMRIRREVTYLGKKTAVSRSFERPGPGEGAV